MCKRQERHFRKKFKKFQTLWSPKTRKMSINSNHSQELKKQNQSAMAARGTRPSKFEEISKIIKLRTQFELNV